MTTFEKAAIVLKHMKRNNLINDETYLFGFSGDYFSIIIFNLNGTLCGSIAVESEMTFGELAHAIMEEIENEEV